MRYIENIPRFNDIEISRIEDQLQQILTTNCQQLDALTNQTSFSWETLVEPLMTLDNHLQTFWSPIEHLHAVVNTPELRTVYDKCIEKITEYETELWQNKKLFQAFEIISLSPEYQQLSFVAQKVISNAIRDFKLSGVHLENDKKQQFMSLQKRLSELQTRFSNHVLDAQQAWQKSISTIDQLSGLPEHALQYAKEQAMTRQLEGYLLTLDYPCYSAVITYADNAALREEIYHAYTTRASELGPHAKQWDNSELMVSILETRHDMAALLGFTNFAQYSLATKMASSTNEVLLFLNDLTAKAKPSAQLEIEALQAFVKKSYGKSSLEPWDIAYYSEKLRKELYAISQEDLRPYFPLDKVLNGLFSLTTQLFGVHFSEVETLDKWHPDVRCFQILGENQEIRGRFYIDLYARMQKRGGAWMDDYCSRLKLPNGDIQIPVAFLCCNFSVPIEGQPALLTHEEVETLFHEFGHGIHHMLTRIDASPVSGIHGVSWDAVELPSQFMENFCWEKEVLALISEHYITHEPLPDTLFKKMVDARHFNSAIQIVRQLEFALFDFRIHLEYQPHAFNHKTIQNILDEVRTQVSVVPMASFNRFQHSFSHIFAGGYAAGYYSYLWAEVLSSDAYSKFEEDGIFNHETGKAFLHAILEMGGSRNAMDLFVEFRGRKPSIEPLLRHRGLIPRSK